MKINFFFAWTKNKDKSNERTKTIGWRLRLPSIFKKITGSKKK